MFKASQLARMAEAAPVSFHLFCAVFKDVPIPRGTIKEIVTSRSHWRANRSVLNGKIAATMHRRMRAVQLLCKYRREQLEITEDLIERAALYPGDIAGFLLDQRGAERIQVSKKFLLVAAKREDHQLMARLLRRLGGRVLVPDDVVKAAAQNRYSPGVISWLLDLQSVELEVTEDVLLAVVNRRSSDVLQLLLKRQIAQTMITKKVLVAAAGHWRSSMPLQLLLEHFGKKIEITEDMLISASKAPAATAKMRLLLQNPGKKVKVTEKVLMAVMNEPHSTFILRLFSEHHVAELRFTEDLMRSLVLCCEDENVLQLFLSQNDTTSQVSEELLRSAMECQCPAVIQLLLKIRNKADDLSKGSVKTLAECAGDKERKLSVKLKNTHLPITEDLIEAAAKNVNYGLVLMSFILEQRDMQAKLTERILKTIVWNVQQGADILSLLSQRPTDFEVTPAIVHAALRCWWECGEMLSLSEQTETRGHLGVKANEGIKLSVRVLKLLICLNALKDHESKQDLSTIIEGSKIARAEMLSVKRRFEDNRGRGIVIPLPVKELSATETLTRVETKRTDAVSIRRRRCTVAKEDRREADPWLSRIVSGRKIAEMPLDSLLGRPLEEYPMSLLLAAASNGQPEVLKLLVCKLGSPESTVAKDFKVARLFYAVKQKDIKTVSELLDAGVPPGYPNSFGHTPLWIAASCGHIEIARKLLLTREANIESKDCMNRTVLFWVAASNDEIMVKLLLKFGAETECMDLDGQTPLQLAARWDAKESMELLKAFQVLQLACANGDLLTVDKLLKKDADVVIFDSQGLTPPLLAIQNGHLEIVRALLRCNAYRDLNGEREVALLNIAVENGHVEVLKLLLGQLPGKTASQNQAQTALHIGVLKGHLGVVRFMLEHGTDVNVRNNDGRTPLILALWKGFFEIVKLLLDAGADLNVCDKRGRTPLSQAVFAGHFEAVKLLLEKRADPSYIGHDKDKALHAARKHGDASTSKTLTKNGINSWSQTPLHLAAQSTCPAIVHLLIRAGANPLLLDEYGRTSLEWAADYEPCFKAMGDWATDFTATPSTVFQARARERLATWLEQAHDISIVAIHDHSFYRLGRLLLFVEDVPAAQIAFAARLYKEKGSLVQMAHCSRCYPSSRIRGHRYVCKACANTDLCEEGFQLRQKITKLDSGLGGSATPSLDRISKREKRNMEPSRLAETRNGNVGPFNAVFERCKTHEFIRVPREGWDSFRAGCVDEHGTTLRQWLFDLHHRYRKELNVT